MPKLLEEKDFEIPLPEKIKRLLIDDFDQINRQKKVNSSTACFCC